MRATPEGEGQRSGDGASELETDAFGVVAAVDYSTPVAIVGMPMPVVHVRTVMNSGNSQAWAERPVRLMALRWGRPAPRKIVACECGSSPRRR